MGNLAIELDEGSSTSLDSKETSGQQILLDVTPDTDAVESRFCPDCSYREDQFRHVRDLEEVTRKAYAGYVAVHGGKDLDVFDSCRTFSWIVYDGDDMTGSYRSNACHRRWCPVCAAMKAAYIARSCRGFFEGQTDARSFVLTLKHSDDPLEDQLKRASKLRAALCRTKFWRKYVTGSVWFLQIKPVDGGRGWHIHYHILATGSYIPQGGLSEIWEKITGDSKIVHVRKVRDLDKALSDVVRYAGRPANLLDVDWEYRIELIHATRRIRLCGTTGSCSEKNGGISLRPPKPEQDEGNVKRISKTETVWALARQGDEDALEFCRKAGKKADAGGQIDPSVIDRLWFKCREIEGKFTGISDPAESRGQPGSQRAPPPMLFEDIAFASGGGW